jgi:hypothetical protein
VEFSDYEYINKPFKTDNEFAEFLYPYGREPNPDRIIDAVIYAEKSENLYNPVIYAALLEIVSKNPYLMEPLLDVVIDEFGGDASEILLIFLNTALDYILTSFERELRTHSYVATPTEVYGDAFLIDVCVGLFFASCSYEAAKQVVLALETGLYADGVYVGGAEKNVSTIMAGDPLFLAYCINMITYDASVCVTVKSELLKVMQDTAAEVSTASGAATI